VVWTEWHTVSYVRENKITQQDFISTMDRVIESKKWSGKKKLIVIGGTAVILLIAFTMWAYTSKSTLNVSRSKITIETVNTGAFQEFIPIDGVVRPLKTIFIDASEGGKVEEKFVEEGAIVKQGDPILRLSNNDLLLDFMNRETALLDQMNNMRNTRISLDQNYLNRKQQLLDLDHDYQEKKRDFERNSKLAKEGVISKAEFEKIEADFNYLTNKRKLLVETVAKDSVFKNIQTFQLESSSGLIQRNLDLVKSSLENLIIKAPISGQLTSLNAEIGETKAKGENIGQLDMAEGFKVTAGVDEHYISRVVTGQKGDFMLDGKSYNVQVKTVLPKVTNGQFQVELLFTGEIPKDIRPGQTLQIKLSLSDRNTALLLPKGSFYQKTGGNWIYVVSGNTAVKREIQLGRQNPGYYEVLGGLQPGEAVIISSYELFGDADMLDIKD
jgi:HlyD family secretion protein